jgi:hypothetical protein
MGDSLTPPAPTPAIPVARWSASRYPDRTSLLDALQPQTLFQYLDLQLRILQRQELLAHRGKQRLGEFALQLFEKFVKGRLERVWTHDNLLSNTMITILQSYSHRENSVTMLHHGFLSNFPSVPQPPFRLPQIDPTQ